MKLVIGEESHYSLFLSMWACEISDTYCLLYFFKETSVHWSQTIPVSLKWSAQCDMTLCKHQYSFHKGKFTTGHYSQYVPNEEFDVNVNNNRGSFIFLSDLMRVLQIVLLFSLFTGRDFDEFSAHYHFHYYC